MSEVSDSEIYIAKMQDKMNKQVDIEGAKRMAAADAKFAAKTKRLGTDAKYRKHAKEFGLDNAF